MTSDLDSEPTRPRSGETRSRVRPTLGSRPGFWPTAALAAASFLIVFEVLAFQLRHGNDPALGGAAPTVSASSPRPVLVRRIVKTRVIADAGQATASSAPSPTQTSSASAPGPAPAPAPAPTPAAPVVSSSS